MNMTSMCRLPLLGLAVLIILSGCTKQHVGSPELVARESAVSSSDVNISRMSSAEQRAFGSTAELDRSLSPVMQAQVRGHFLKYARDKRVSMEVFLRNSMPYLNHTKSVFRKRGLPEDLAYLAYLESGYNPLAVSSSKAVGMWQFIASTGKHYGLRQDWWMDERMDPYRSTEAAADYLTYLYSIFHDWHLAVASYNGGEGKIGRAKKAAGADNLQEIIQKNASLDYSLQLREETRLYVPRFLAIAKVMRNAETLGLKPAAPDADHPVLLPSAPLTAKPATDLVELARRLGMTWKEFLAYNPQFLRSISPADRESTVYVPRNKESQARRLLAGKLSGAGWTYYTVASKDTFAQISRKTGVPVAVIKQVNGSSLKKGQRLRIPARKGAIPAGLPILPPMPTGIASNTVVDNASAAILELEKDARIGMPATYTVASGDTLYSISARYNVPVKSIYEANGGEKKLKTLSVGQVLKMPVDKYKSSAPAKVMPATHKVASGDTLSGIALKYGTTVAEIQAANGGASKVKTLRVGQELKLPGAQKASVQSQPAASQAAAPKAAPAKVMPATHKVASGDTLSGIALKYGTTVAEIQAANGGASKLKTLRVGQELKLPGAQKASVQAQPVAAAAPKAAPAKAMPVTHKVASGDTLSSIARKYGTTVAELQSVNGGASKVQTLRVGQELKLPGAQKASAQDQPVAAQAAAPKVAPAKAETVKAEVAKAVAVKRSASTHTVASGDTLTNIARRYDTTVAELQAANGGASKVQTLRIGQVLDLPVKHGDYQVQSGESVWSISRKFGMSPSELLALNGLGKDASLRVGDTVKVILNK